MRGRLLVGAILLLLVVLLLSPLLAWLALPWQDLEVVVVDNTVPDRSYREHRGIVWALNHLKYRSPERGPYLADRDYYGFLPLGDSQYVTRELPDTIAADLIYVADTYGVYEKEWYGENPLGERSPIVYGGTSPAELDKIERAVLGGTPLVVEFNSFASPTGGATRERLQRLVQVEWSGWIGRFFHDLTEGVEVPVWAVRAYERQYAREWTFSGEGFVLVDERDTVIVLQPGIDFSAGQCEAIFPDSVRARFDVPDGVGYRYWFDIVRLREGARELAHFHLDLTAAGRAQLAAHGVPERFPAVVRYESGSYWAYYFAGDFADLATVPEYHRILGYAGARARFTRDVGWRENEAFFWKVYVPLLRSVFAEARARAGTP